MEEAQLRTDVLIPLFRNMGFRDVRLHHGGSLEQGKDIVMWSVNQTGNRTNYAVVAKSKALNGRAQGPGSAGEVATQVRQAFGRAYEDASTLEPQHIHECLVVCPHEASKEAIHAVVSDVDERNRRYVRFLTGHELWTMIQKYLGPRAALAQLQEVGEVFENVNPNYRIVARTVGAQVEVGIAPKHAAAHADEPLTIKAQFAFPADDEGKAALADLVRHVETGSPARVAAQYIKQVEVPDLMRQIMGPDIKEIAMQSAPSTAIRRLSLEIRSLGGEQISIADLDFKATQAGTKEATLVAERSPYKVTLVLRHAAKQVGIAITANLFGVNAVEALMTARLRRVYAGGCTLTFLDGRTKLPVTRIEIPPGTVQPFENDLEGIFEDLVAIQQLTGIPIEVPDRDLRWKELRDARAIAHALRTGSIAISATDLTARITRQGVEQILASPGSMRIAIVSEESAHVLDTQVPVGRVARVIVGAVSVADRERLVSELLNRDLDGFDVKLDCSRAQSTALYLDRLPPEALEQYRGILPPPLRPDESVTSRPR